MTGPKDRHGIEIKPGSEVRNLSGGNRVVEQITWWNTGGDSPDGVSVKAAEQVTTGRGWKRSTNAHGYRPEQLEVI